MLHGHTKIELKNEKTGEVQVVEKDNMVTNAVANILKAWGAYTYMTNSISSGSPLDNILPLSSKGMGGILCFEDVLDENVDNMAVPVYSNKIIAFANSSTTISSNTRKGQKNLTESIALENGYKFVYDFGTDKGNGQISAIAISSNSYCTSLTPNTIGTFSKNANPTISGFSSLSELIYGIVSYDLSTDIVTCLYTIDVDKVRYSKMRANFKSFGINDTEMNGHILSSQEISIVGETDITQNLIWKEGEDDYYYGVYVTATGNLYIRRINKNTLKYDESFKINITSSIIKSYLKPVSKNSSTCWFEIMGNYIYFCCYLNSYTNFVRVNMKDTSDIIYNRVNKQLISNAYMYMCRHKDYIAGNGYILKPDLTYINASYFWSFDNCINPVASDYPIYILYNSYGRLNVNIYNDYLATINNLDTPVIKTSEQSMKITYTITEVEDE